MLKEIKKKFDFYINDKRTVYDFIPHPRWEWIEYLLKHIEQQEAEIESIRGRCVKPATDDKHADIHKLVNDKMKFITNHKEELIQAWIAKTGLHPDESVLVQQEVDGVTRMWVEARKPDDELKLKGPAPEKEPKYVDLWVNMYSGYVALHPTKEHAETACDSTAIRIHLLKIRAEVVEE